MSGQHRAARGILEAAVTASAAKKKFDLERREALRRFGTLCCRHGAGPHRAPGIATERRRRVLRATGTPTAAVGPAESRWWFEGGGGLERGWRQLDERRWWHLPAEVAATRCDPPGCLAGGGLGRGLNPGPLSCPRRLRCHRRPDGSFFEVALARRLRPFTSTTWPWFSRPRQRRGRGGRQPDLRPLSSGGIDQRPPALALARAHALRPAGHRSSTRPKSWSRICAGSGPGSKAPRAGRRGQRDPREPPGPPALDVLCRAGPAPLRVRASGHPASPGNPSPR